MQHMGITVRHACLLFITPLSSGSEDCCACIWIECSGCAWDDRHVGFRNATDVINSG